MTTLATLDRLATPLAAATLRGAVILLGALLLTMALRRRSAAARHAVWAGAIIMQLVVLLLGTWGPRWRIETPAVVASAVSPLVALPAAEQVTAPPPRDVSNVAVADVPSPVAAPIAASVPAIAAAPATSMPDVVRSPVSWRAVALVLWLAGALVVLVRLGVGTALVAALARRGARVDDGGWLSLTQRLATTLQIDRPLTLMRGTRVGVPITWGIIYPVVLLPDDADSWPEERRRFVLLHEMAHVKRLDALTQLVGQFVLALFWFNPLVWIANRRMQLEREHACDDYVLRHGTVATTYADELLAMVRRLGTPEHRDAQPAFGALAMARRSEFEGRMLSILDPVQDRHPLSRGRTLMSVAAALLVVVPLAALQPYRAAEPRSAPRPVAIGTVAPSAPSLMDRTPVAWQGTATPAAPAAPQAPVAQPGTFAPSAPAAPSAPTAHSAWPAPPAQPSTPAQPAAPSPSVGIAAGVQSAQRALAASAATFWEAGKQLSTLRAKYNCDDAAFNVAGNSVVHIHSDHDDGRDGVVDYYALNETRCVQATMVGDFTFAPDESDITSFTGSGLNFFRERTRTDDRTVIVHQLGGRLEHSYTHNGQPAEFDADARRWFAGFLPVVLADAGLNVRPRVERWRSEGGVDRALRGISGLRSSGAKRSHYEALLDQRLPAADVQRIAQQAGKDLSGSGDMRAVLLKAAPSVRGSAAAASLMSAIAAIPSSGDRTAVLLAYGDTDNRDALLGIMRIARDIPSSGDRTRLLNALAPRYLAGNDEALRDAFFATLVTIPSSGDLRNVLVSSVQYARNSDPQALAVIEASRHVASSGDRAGVLVALANANPLRSSGLRDAYLRAVQDIPSSGDMRRALEALPRQ